MKRVLFLIRSLGAGGAQRVLVDTVNALADHYEITVQSIYGGEGLQHELAPGVRYRAIIGTRCRLWAMLKGFLIRRVLPPRLTYRACINDGYDIEIAYLEGEATRLLSRSTNRRARRLAFVHTDMMDNFTSQGVYRSFDEHRAAYLAYDRIVCVSEHTRRRFTERFGISDKVCVAYNFCDGARVRRLSAAAATGFVRGSGRQLLTVSNLRPEKRHVLLLEVLSALRDEGCDFTLHIVGDGPERAAIEAAVLRLSLGERVRLLGHCDNPYPYMRESDVLIVASSAEGYGMVVQEAGLLGLPVLSTDCGGIHEAAAGGCDITVVPNSAQGLKDGLRALLTHTTAPMAADNNPAAGEEITPSAAIGQTKSLTEE